MIKEELIKRSPFRILERSTGNGLGKGNIGGIAAPKGVGKTACLVHLATDRLFQGKQVVHVSFASDTSHIVSWYEEIFEEIARRNNLEGAKDIHDDTIRHRIILNFKQDGGVQASHIEKSVQSIMDNSGFQPDLIIVDGYDFSKSNAIEFHKFKEMAEKLQSEIWFSISLNHKESALDKHGIPLILQQYMEDILILITLEPKGDFIHLNLVKDHELFPKRDLHLKLDPYILLIADEK